MRFTPSHFLPRWGFPFLVLGLLLGELPRAASAASCKPIPGDDDWPTQKDWDLLNQTVAGKLIATVPIASVCHTEGIGSYNYNATACSELQEVWPDAHIQ
jgi:hypothetical protein